MRTLPQRTRGLSQSKPLAGAIASASGDGLYRLGLVPQLGTLPANLAEVHALCCELGIRQLWLTAAAGEAIGLPSELDHRHPGPHPFLEHGRLKVPLAQNVLSPWLSVWGDDGAGTSHYVEVALPFLEPRRRDGSSSSVWGSEDFAPALLGDVLEFSEATGMYWRRSGAVTSDAWLRERWRGSLARIEYPEVADDANLEPDAKWHRKASGKHHTCVGFDLNAMYLGAASSLALPAGAPFRTAELWALPERGAAYVRDEDGAWCTMPTWQWEHAAKGRSFAEAWAWAETHRYLEPWYRALRVARTELMAHPGPALEAVKAVYREGIGRFGSTRRSREDDELYQPYWRHALQAEARTRLERRIAKFTEQPVAVDVDCCYFLTSQATPERFAEKIGLPLGAGIGQFKIAGTMPAKAAREALAAPETHRALAALREGLS